MSEKAAKRSRMTMKKMKDGGSCLVKDQYYLMIQRFTAKRGKNANKPIYRIRIAKKNGDAFEEIKTFLLSPEQFNQLILNMIDLTWQDVDRIAEKYS